MPTTPVAHFEIVDAEFCARSQAAVSSAACAASVERNDAAVDTERGGYQRIAEHETLDLREGQHTANFTVRRFGEQVMRLVAERLLQNVLPFGQMKERCFRMRAHERVPRRAIGEYKGPHGDCGRLIRRHRSDGR